MKITSYLVFNGQAEEAAGFYTDALGGKIENLHSYDQWPPSPDAPQIPAGYEKKIMHCCISFPGGTMSVADTLPSDPRDFGNGGHILTLNCDSVSQAEDAYTKLSRGAQAIPCELCEVFYAKRYGEIVDKFGVRWAVMCEEK